MKTCQEVVELIATNRLDQQPSWIRWAIWTHLRLCRHCHRFAKQLQQIRRLCRCSAQATPPDLEEKIIRRLTQPQPPPR